MAFVRLAAEDDDLIFGERVSSGKQLARLGANRPAFRPGGVQFRGVLWLVFRFAIDSRGQIVLLKTPERTLKRVLMLGKRYLVPRIDGHVLVGSTEEPEAGFEKVALYVDAGGIPTHAAKQLDHGGDILQVRDVRNGHRTVRQEAPGENGQRCVLRPGDAHFSL